MAEDPDCKKIECKLVSFLENSELDADEERKISKPKLATGIVFAILGIGAMALVIVDDFSRVDIFPEFTKQGEMARNFTIAAFALLIVLGIPLAIAGVSSQQFRMVNVRVHRYGVIAGTLFQWILFGLVLACTALFSVEVGSAGLVDADLGVIVPMVAIMLFAIYGIYELGAGPINIGVSSIRRRFNGRRISAGLESVSLGCIAVCFMVAMASMHESPASMALGVLSVLIGYFSFKMKVLDDAFSEATKLFYEIRNQAWRHHLILLSGDPGSKSATDLRHGVIDAYRELLISMQRTPVFSRKPVNAVGLQLLCHLADLREARAVSAGLVVGDTDRKKLAEEILAMSDAEFSLASAIVFDAYGEILAGSSGRIYSTGKGEGYKGFDSDLAKVVALGSIASVAR